MAWEDCVVDVHSVKLSQHTLESMFSKCGAVRSVIHWKGQGEKEHVFMEYRSPSAADSARAIGLDRSDLQVIKLSNNEMLKRKFRELENGSTRLRSTSSHTERDTDMEANVKDYRLPAKPAATSAYTGERYAEGRYRGFDSERSRPRHGQSWTSSASHSTSSFSNSRAAGHSSPFQADSSGVDKHSAPPRSPSTFTGLKHQVKPDPSDLHGARDLISNRDYSNAGVTEALSATPRSCVSNGPGEASVESKPKPNKSDIPQAVLEIPHAGEIIKFDLDKQLEPNPTGIIRILSTVKADQKLWMMTAAHYNGKHNLEAAKEVLEAGIDMAVQAGTETDTKPFWHLLSQINGSLKSASTTSSSVFSASPTNSTFTSIEGNANQECSANYPEYMHNAGDVSPSVKDESRLPAVPRDSVHAPSRDFSSASNICGTTQTKTYPLSRHPAPPVPQHSRSIGPRNRDLQLNPRPSSPAPPSGPMGTPARLHSLQNEIGLLREKQSAVLEDLSFMRAAKRRAEDEIKEERSVRRKLEKHLKAAEDALARSKRMEDAALDQVKREVEARRKAEDLLAATKADKDRAGGASLFTHTSVNEAAMLLQLASMIRGVPNDPANPWQNRLGATGTGVASSTAGSQPDT